MALTRSSHPRGVPVLGSVLLFSLLAATPATGQGNRVLARMGGAAAPSAAAAKPAATPVVRLDRLLSLGGDLAGRETAFADVADVAAGASGEIYVLDAGDRSVRVFSPAGRLVRRFGREGEGPGEFNVPVALRVDSVIAVSDLAQQRMSYFSLEGRHLRTSRTAVSGSVPLLRMVPLRHGRLVAVTPARVGVGTGGTERTGSPYSAVVTSGPDGRLDTLLRPHSGVAIFHPRNGQVPFGTFESHAGRGGAHAVLGDTLVATADGYTGAVTWYRVERQGLTRIRTAQLHSRSRAVTANDQRRMERELYARHPDLPRGLVVEPPPAISIATEALFAPDGSLWIRNTAGQGVAHVWTVFDAGGRMTLRLSLPVGFELRHVRGDRLYGVARTANDAPVVQVYRMVRGG